MHLAKSILTTSIALLACATAARAEIFPIFEDTAGTATGITKKAGSAKTLAISAKSTAFINFAVGSSGIDPAKVTAARLTIYVAKASPTGTLTIKNLNAGFSETPVATIPLPAQGTTLDTINLATIPLNREFYIADITNQVKAWLTTPASEFGVAISGDATALATLASKEGAGSGHPAILEIDVSGSSTVGPVTGTTANFTGTVTAPTFAGNATSATTAVSFTGALAGDVTGTQGANTIATGAVTSAKIADGTITNADISAGFVFPGGTVADGSITSAKLAQNLTLGGNTTAAGLLFGTDNQTLFGRSATGLRGDANGIQFNGGTTGVLIEDASGDGESGGFFANGNTAAIWSPADTGAIVSFYDEDGFPGAGGATDPGTPKSFIAENGSYVVGSGSDQSSFGSRVGIGTTTPNVKLEVLTGGNDGIRITGPGGQGTTVHLDLSTYEPVGLGGIDPSARIQAVDDNFSSFIHFQTKAPGAADNTLNTRMTIAPTGNVGIASATPETDLEIGRYNSGNRALRLATQGGNLFTASIDFRHDSANNGFTLRSDERGAGPSGFHIIDVTGTEATRLFIANDTGLVGIGRTDPGFRLDVNGGIRCVGAVNTTSDARYKTHVAPLDGALAKTLALRGVSYDWDRAGFPNQGFDDRRQVGFIAQEVRGIVPEVVSEDAQGFLSIGYSALVPVLAEAIEELKAQKDSEIAALKEANTVLTEKLGALEAGLAARVARLEATAPTAPAATSSAPVVEVK